MMVVVERLLAAITEAERIALAASPGPWRANAEHDEVLAVDDEVVCEGFALSNNQLRATVDHVAHNDPAAVLRRCQADREIVQWANWYLCDSGPGCGFRRHHEQNILRPLARAYGISTEEETG